MDTTTIYDAYMERFGAFLPIEKNVVNQFLSTYPIFKTCEDLKYLVNMLYDFVGSQQMYEEGSEEVW